MKNYGFLNDKGTFYVKNPENTSYLYFPLVGEQGVKSAITPNLGGDIKNNQNQFVLQPVSVEDLHNNKSTRNFWCNISGSGIWSATGVSAEEQANKFSQDKEETYLEAGILWHKLTRESSKYGLKSQILSFVPSSHPNTEVMQVKISNTSSEPITFTPTAAIPIYGRSADNIRDHRHVTSLLHRIKTRKYSVSVDPTLTFDERGHKKNNITYFVSGVTEKGNEPKGFYPVVESYIGEGGSFEWPEAIVRNLPPVTSGYSCEGYEAMGAIQFDETTLLPNEDKTYIVLIGLYNNDQEEDSYIDKLTEEFNSHDKLTAHFKETCRYWANQSNVKYHTGDEEFDNFMNWVNIQPTLRRLFGCSFLPHHDYGKGGRGWRDLWQDLLALIIMHPKDIKDMLINNFAGVRVDGTNATIIGDKPGEFIADRNNITRVWMDHGVWPCITTKLYIEQTGDILILLTNVTYFKDRQVVRGSKIDEKWTNDTPTVLLDSLNKTYYGTVLEHLLLQNLTAFYEVGEHNHIRLRGADWNDALDMAPNRGESVAFTAAYAKNLSDLADLISILKEKHQINEIEVMKEMEILFTDDAELYDSIESKNNLLEEYCNSCYYNVSGEKIYIPSDKVISSLRNKADWIKDNIRENEWIKDQDDSGWFNGYYDDSGNRVEGFIDGSPRMMLTSQVFTIMSETASKDQVEQLVNAADKHLYDKNVGGYRLNTNFNEVKLDLGRMFGFAYGHKENGAVFSHMTVMYSYALYERGFAKEGFKAIDTLYSQAIDFPKSKIYPGIPEYFNSDGRGMYHYLTGSASWLLLTVISQMFGVRGNQGDLIIEPKLVKEQFDHEGKINISLEFQNKKFNIIYINKDNKDYGEYIIKDLYFNGMKKSVDQSSISISLEEIMELDKKKTHEIILVLNN